MVVLRDWWWLRETRVYLTLPGARGGRGDVRVVGSGGVGVLVAKGGAGVKPLRILAQGGIPLLQTVALYHYSTSYFIPHTPSYRYTATLYSCSVPFLHTIPPYSFSALLLTVAVYCYSTAILLLCTLLFTVTPYHSAILFLCTITHCCCILLLYSNTVTLHITLYRYSIPFCHTISLHYYSLLLYTLTL